MFFLLLSINQLLMTFKMDQNRKPRRSYKNAGLRKFEECCTKLCPMFQFVNKLITNEFSRRLTVIYIWILLQIELINHFEHSINCSLNWQSGNDSQTGFSLNKELHGIRICRAWTQFPYDQSYIIHLIEDPHGNNKRGNVVEHIFSSITPQAIQLKM